MIGSEILYVKFFSSAEMEALMRNPIFFLLEIRKAVTFIKDYYFIQMQTVRSFEKSGHCENQFT